MTLATTDLCDAHPDVQVCDPVFTAFGGRTRLQRADHHAQGLRGQLAWCARRCRRRARAGCSSSTAAVRCAAALFGGNLAVAAARNGWAGVVVHGCVARRRRARRGSRSASGRWRSTRGAASAVCTRVRPACRCSSPGSSSARASGSAPTATASSCCPRGRPGWPRGQRRRSSRASRCRRPPVGRGGRRGPARAASAARRAGRAAGPHVVRRVGAALPLVAGQHRPGGRDAGEPGQSEQLPRAHVRNVAPCARWAWTRPSNSPAPVTCGCSAAPRSPTAPSGRSPTRRSTTSAWPSCSRTCRRCCGTPSSAGRCPTRGPASASAACSCTTSPTPSAPGGSATASGPGCASSSARPRTAA